MEGAALDRSVLGGLLDDAPPPPRRRGLLLGLVGVLVLGLLGAGGWVGAGWLRDADARSALTTSAAVMTRLGADLRAARSGRDLGDVAAGLPSAQERLERAQARAVRRPGEAADRAAAEVRAQVAVLEALRPLEGMGRGPLQAWGRVRGPLREALRREAGSRDDLAASRPAAAARLAVVDGLAPALDAAAGPLLRRAAHVEVDRVEGVLAEARTTGDVRAAGEVALGQAEALRRSVAVAPDPGTAAALARCSAMVAAVAGLVDLSGEDPVPWTVARTRLARTVGWTAALASVDEVVRRAVQAERQHQDAVVLAQAAQEADLAALTAHASAVRGSTSSYADLDARLAALLPTLVQRAATEVELAALREDAAARQRLAVALAGLVAPPLVAPEHARLVQAAAAEPVAVAALTAALAAPVRGPLPAVPLEELVRRQSAAGVARVAAAQAWEAAVGRARTLTATRPLPERPQA